MSITIPDAEIELAACCDESRPVLTHVAMQNVHGKRYLVATDTYIMAAVPIDDPGDGTDEVLVPKSLLTQARRALADARKRYRKYNEGGEDGIDLIVEGDKIRLTIKNADFGGARGDVNAEMKRMNGRFPQLQQIIEQNGKLAADKISYGAARITFNANHLVRLAKALGATHGRGKTAYSFVTLDLPLNEDGTVNPFRPIRVQPDGIGGAIGLLMPSRPLCPLQRALDAWPDVENEVEA